MLRFPFVYGDGDGHLDELPKHVVAANFHPAMRMSTIHHRDIYKAMKIALQGIMDRRNVNIADEAPTTLYELLQLVGESMASSEEPLTNPWYLHADASLARSLGFQASIRTIELFIRRHRKNFSDKNSVAAPEISQRLQRLLKHLIFYHMVNEHFAQCIIFAVWKR